jgi:hypothetical protein
MADLDTIRSRVAEIDELLASGVRSTMADGLRVDYDTNALERERDRLNSILSGAASRSQFRGVVMKRA